MRSFYVYLHCKPDGTPFYVGKGTGYRAYVMGKSRTLHHQNVIRKYGIDNVQVFIFPSDSEKNALLEEIQAIKNLRDQGVKLVNMTDGGEGSSGFKPSKETREKISARMTGVSLFAGKSHSDETRKRIAESLRETYKSNPRPARPRKAQDAVKFCKSCSAEYESRECISCKKEQNRLYRLKNRDALLVAQKKRYIENLDANRARRSAYYEKNKEKIKADSKRWAEMNPDKIKEKYAKRRKTGSLADKVSKDSPTP